VRSHPVWLGLVVLTVACGPYDVVVSEPRWSMLGASASGSGLSAPGTFAMGKKLAVDSEDRVYVAWSDRRNGHFDCFLRFWDEQQGWMELGGSDSGGGISNGGLSGAAESQMGALRLDRAGRPAIAWQHRERPPSESYQTHFRIWDGSSWRELEGSASQGGVSLVGGALWPSLAIDAEGQPFVAWTVAGGVPVFGTVYARRWSGTAWEEVGGSASGTGISGGEGGAGLVETAAAADGGLFAVWQSSWAGTSAIYLAAWDGVSWSGLGGSLAAGGLRGTQGAERPGLAVSPDGKPTVTWQTTAEPSGVAVRQWSGGAWMDLEPPSPSGSQVPALAFSPDGRLVLVWHQQDEVGVNVHGALFDGGWRSLDPPGVPGGISGTSTDSQWADVTASDQWVYVGWEERLSNDAAAVYVKRRRMP